MGMPHDSEKQNVRERMRGLCLDLNVDVETEEDAWDAFDRLSYNYTLEVGGCVTFIRVVLLLLCWWGACCMQSIRILGLVEVIVVVGDR